MAHGDGRVYQPKRHGKPLSVWYYEIFFNGRRKIGRGFRTRKEAEEALKAERKRKARGDFVLPEVERLTVKNLLDNYSTDLADRGRSLYLRSRAESHASRTPLATVGQSTSELPRSRDIGAIDSRRASIGQRSIARSRSSEPRSGSRSSESR